MISIPRVLRIGISASKSRVQSCIYLPNINRSYHSINKTQTLFIQQSVYPFLGTESNTISNNHNAIIKRYKSVDSETKVEQVSSSAADVSKEVVANPSITDTTKEVTSSIIDTSKIIKWETSSEPLSSFMDLTLTSAIQPWAQLTFVQKLFFPFTYILMYTMGTLETYMPLWAALATTTIIMRLMTLPFFIKGHKQRIISANLSPETQKMSLRINEARAFGELQEKELNMLKLHQFEKKHGIDAWTKLKPQLMTTGFFITMFLMTRNLAEVPHVGFTTGGILWFENLTVPDPYYILPLLTSTTIWATMKVGIETSTTLMKVFVNVVPILTFLFFQNFAAGLNLFWLCSNLFTLCLNASFESRTFRRVLKIPEKIIHPPEALPLSNLSFKESFSKMFDQARKTKTTVDLRRLDDLEFRKAGSGPILKTFKEPPSKMSE